MTSSKDISIYQREPLINMAKDINHLRVLKKESNKFGKKENDFI